MIDPKLYSAKWECALGHIRSSCNVMMTSSTVGKFDAILAKIAYFWAQFTPRRKGDLGKNTSYFPTSKINELSENHPKFWIVSFLDRDIRDLVGSKGSLRKMKAKKAWNNAKFHFFGTLMSDSFLWKMMDWIQFTNTEVLKITINVWKCTARESTPIFCRF